MSIPLTLAPALAGGADAQLIELWAHGRSRHTQRAYRADAAAFLAFVAPAALAAVTLARLHAYADVLAARVARGGSVETQRRRLASVKSLYAFGFRLGYLPFDTAKALKLPEGKDGLAARILTAAQVRRLLDALPADEPGGARNRLMLRFLYVTGCRVSELCGLKWRDLAANDAGGPGGGQATLFGKGNKTRAVLLPPAVWAALAALRESGGAGGGAGEEKDPVFANRLPVAGDADTGRHLRPDAVAKIVKRAARLAGLIRRAGGAGGVSPHWLRHAHASHALDGGAPPHLVSATLGHASLATTGRYAHARPTDSSGNYLAV